jgi:membrane protein YqaA with SNARE-associated domain
VAIATAGNTAGGMTSYALGRLVPQKDLQYLNAVKRHGAPALLFAWLPLVGDALCVAAGWLRIHWAAALGFMATGRLARYIAVASLA